MLSLYFVGPILPNLRVNVARLNVDLFVETRRVLPLRLLQFGGNRGRCRREEETIAKGSDHS